MTIWVRAAGASGGMYLGPSGHGPGSRFTIGASGRAECSARWRQCLAIFSSQQEEFIARAYDDEPLPIGDGQTISQPFMVAAMAEALMLNGGEHVLEIGAGSGYQAAVLSLLARDVTTLEKHVTLANAATERLAMLGYTNVQIEEADGSLGWSAGAPYDAILVTAAAPAVPPPLVDQLAEGGRLVIPVGSSEQQDLIRIVKRDGRVSKQSLYACRFVPLRGFFGWRENSQESTRG